MTEDQKNAIVIDHMDKKIKTIRDTAEQDGYSKEYVYIFLNAEIKATREHIIPDLAGNAEDIAKYEQRIEHLQVLAESLWDCCTFPDSFCEAVESGVPVEEWHLHTGLMEDINN